MSDLFRWITWRWRRTGAVAWYIYTRRPQAFVEISAAIIMGGRTLVSFYGAAARAWREPTVSWHAAPHQSRNKSIFILTQVSPTPSPHPALFSLSSRPLALVSFSSALVCSPQWFSALNRGQGEAEVLYALLLLHHVPLLTPIKTVGVICKCVKHRLT